MKDEIKMLILLILYILLVGLTEDPAHSSCVTSDCYMFKQYEQAVGTDMAIQLMRDDWKQEQEMEKLEEQWNMRLNHEQKGKDWNW